MRFADFMDLALYHPDVGYYHRRGPRVGYGAGTDFYTASTSTPVFGELIAAAAAGIVRGRGRNPADYTFVEIGAEAGRAILADATHPFRTARTLALGDPLVLEGACIVFSNELFDAQPFARYVQAPSGWQEVWVEDAGDRLRERLQPASAIVDLPDATPVGYCFDAPRAARDLAERIARQPWHGLFLALDYGKPLAELATETPQGTARAYFRHTQSNDLLARPGEQDLTCHVCWDWLVDALDRTGFTTSPVRSQESFLMTHAAPVLQQLVDGGGAQLTRRKLSLMQLLHPAHLGQKFQALSAWRDREDCPCTA